MRQDTDGYYRVSTPKQALEGSALERYRADLIQAGVSLDRIFYDVESGASASRAGYNTILERVRSGITKRVLVPCFDRFTRSPILWEQAMIELKSAGAHLELLSGGFVDLESPEGTYKSRIDAAASAYVREKNQHAARKGWEYRRKRLKAGNPPFGYAVENNRYVINSDHYQIARDAINTFLADGTQRGTSRKLIERYGKTRTSQRNGDEIPKDRSKFAEWLKNPVLRGHTAYFGSRGREREIVAYNTHDALISPHEAAQIDRLLEAKSLKRVARMQADPLAGLIFCVCGAKCIRVRKWCYCDAVYNSHKFPDRKCDRRNGARLSDAESAAIIAITTQATKVAEKVDIPVDEPVELKELRRKLERLGDDPDYEDSRRVLKQKIAKQETALSNESSTLSLRHATLVEVGSDPEFWVSLDDVEKRFVFVQLIDRIVKNADKIVGVQLAAGLGSISFENRDDS